MASKGGDYSRPGAQCVPLLDGCPTVVPISARAWRYYRPEGITIQLILANFLAVYANDRDSLTISRTPLRVMVNISNADSSPATNHRFEFCQQHFAQMTTTPAVNYNFGFAVQAISITGARFLIAARPPHPAPIPSPAPVTALKSPHCGSSIATSQAPIIIPTTGNK